MKHFRMAACLFAAASMAFVPVACSDDDNQQQQGITDVNTPSGETNFTEETYAAYAAKYNVQDPNFEFESFEFLADGTYILTRRGYTSYVRKAEKPVVINSRKDIARLLRTPHKATRATDNYYFVYGSYTIESDGSFRLDNYGNVVISPDASVIRFTNNETGITSTVDVNKEHNAYTGGNTQKLCRTWTLKYSEIWASYNGIQMVHAKFDLQEAKLIIFDINSRFLDPDMSIEEAKQEVTEELMDYDETPQSVTFSPNGTYFVTYRNGLCEKSTWKWGNEANGIIYYNWSENNDDIDGEGYTTVTFKDKYAYIKEDYTEKEDGETYRMIGVITMEAR